MRNTEKQPLKNNPLISIVIPCYNASETIGKAINSIIFQTYKNWEIIVINDGSTDDTEKILHSYNGINIKYHSFPKNKGRGYARQKGLEMASGKYLAMVDADDWILSDKLEVQVKIMEADESIALVSTGMIITNDEGHVAGERNISYDDNTKVKFDKLDNPPIPHAPSMIRMDIAKNYRYDPDFLLGQDVDFIFKIVYKRNYVVIQKPFYVYSEVSSFKPHKVYAALGYNIKMMNKYKSEDALAVLIYKIKTHFKIVAYFILFNTIGINRVLNRRLTPPSEETLKRYNKDFSLLNLHIEAENK